MTALRMLGFGIIFGMLLPALMPAAYPDRSVAEQARTEHASAALIQSLIDRARPDDLVQVPAGTYAGSLVIDQTVTLLADGEVKLIHDGADPAVRISADGVRLQGFTIVDTSLKEAPSIFVEADRVMLGRLRIYSASHGVQLVGADKGEIRDSTIIWQTSSSQEVKLSNRRNGIDLYESHENRIIGNAIADMHDGIYMESSHRNVVEGNQVDRMRYGIHCMYTNGTVIRNNTGSYNITGAMVMAVKYIEVTGNLFFKQNENVNAQGILLFDAHASRFYDNRVEGNRVGFYIEQSSDNILMRNRVRQNFIGIQFIESSGNRLSGNVLSGNVIDAEARLSADNQLDGNFWDSFSGIDMDGDGRSDIPNAINPFFQTIVKDRPAFQLFFRSPGMLFLESLFQADRAAWLADRSPLMEPPVVGKAAAAAGSENDAGLWGAALLAVSLFTLLFLGVRRT